MLCWCCSLKIALPLSIVGYQSTATANGFCITIVTLVDEVQSEEKYQIPKQIGESSLW